MCETKITTKMNFDNEKTFARFKEVKQVKVGDVIFDIKISTTKSCAFPYTDDVFHVNFYNKGKWENSKTKELLHERWLTIDGVLHYIQRINHWMGKTKCNYIKAEL